MSTESELWDLSQIARILRRHSSPEVHKTAEALDRIAGLISLYHQPTCFRVLKVGYTCFNTSDQETLAATIASLKRIFRKARFLIRRPTIKAKAKVMDVLIEKLEFPPDDLAEAMQLVNILRGLVASERLLAYISYILGKIRRTRLWRQSHFGKWPWSEVGVVLQNTPTDFSLDELLCRLSLKWKFDLDVVKMWIHLAGTMTSKDQYIVNAVKEYNIDRLRDRVQTDGCDLDIFTSADTLETRAYRIAYFAFREEWFEDVTPNLIDLNDRAWASLKRQLQAEGHKFVSRT
jgi:hypothetical protein